MPATRLTTIGPAANGIAKFTAPDAPSRLGERACARAKPARMTTAKRIPVARTEPKTTPDERSRLRRRCRRASSQKAAAARIWRRRTPVTLTHEDGSDAEARTAAIHWAERAVISSPRRTITFPRGILVKTLSTEREAAARRSPVRAAS